MSENPPPSGSGRDPAWNGNGQQGHWGELSAAAAQYRVESTVGMQAGINRPIRLGSDRKSVPTMVGAKGLLRTLPLLPTRTPGRSARRVNPLRRRPHRASTTATVPAASTAPAGAGTERQCPIWRKGPIPPHRQRSPAVGEGLIAMGVVLIVFVALGIGWGAATLFGNDSDGDTVAAPASSEAKSTGK